MHSIRRVFILTGSLVLAAAVSPASAQDGSNQPIFGAAAAARSGPDVPHRKPALTPWRTIVIPAAAPAQALHVMPAAAAPMAHPPSHALTGYAHEMAGLASYYWQEQKTSSGERFDRRGMTAAHKTLPLGTRVRVTNLANGKSTVVRINDRGPFKAGRVIDLSEAAAEQLSMTGPGIARVALEVLR